MTPRQLRKICKLQARGQTILKDATEELSLTALAHTKVLRVVRTIADREPSVEIKPQHIAEADGYQWLDLSVCI